MPPRINQVVIYVSDMGRSVAFYRDGLGFPVRSESESWSEIDAGALTLALHITSEAPVNAGWLAAGSADVQVAVDNIEAARRRLIDRGIDAPEPMVMEDIGLAIVQVHDPDGLTITISATTA